MLLRKEKCMKGLLKGNKESMGVFMMKKGKTSHIGETISSTFNWLLNILLRMHSQKQSWLKWLKLYEFLIKTSLRIACTFSDSVSQQLLINSAEHWGRAQEDLVLHFQRQALPADGWITTDQFHIGALDYLHTSLTFHRDDWHSCSVCHLKCALAHVP